MLFDDERTRHDWVCSLIARPELSDELKERDGVCSFNAVAATPPSKTTAATTGAISALCDDETPSSELSRGPCEDFLDSRVPSLSGSSMCTSSGVAEQLPLANDPECSDPDCAEVGRMAIDLAVAPVHLPDCSIRGTPSPKGSPPEYWRARSSASPINASDAI